MIIDQNYFAKEAESFIDNNCQSNTGNPLKFKSYLHKDEANCFTVIDSSYCIKCLFEKEFLKNYFSTYPSYYKLDHFDGMLIFIKNAIFDVLFFKNVNKTISYRIVLIIKEFDLDSAQKLSNDIYSKKYENINSLSQIENKMEKFYYSFLKEKMEKFYGENLFDFHLSLNAKNFIENKYQSKYEIPPNQNNHIKPQNSPLFSVYKIFKKGKIFTLLNNDELKFENLVEDPSLKSSSGFLKEIKFNEDVMDVDEGENSPEAQPENNITIENLQNLDFSSLFYHHPSQKDKKDKNFSYENIDLNNLNFSSNNNLLGNKTQREEVNDINSNDFPQEILDLVKKMEGKPPLTMEIFEKYKSYKKFNSNLYIKDSDDDNDKSKINQNSKGTSQK